VKITAIDRHLTAPKVFKAFKKRNKQTDKGDFQKTEVSRQHDFRLCLFVSKNGNKSITER